MKTYAPSYGIYDVVTLEQLQKTLERLSKEFGPQAKWYVWKDDGGLYVSGDAVEQLRAIFPYSKGGRRSIPSPFKTRNLRTPK